MDIDGRDFLVDRDIGYQLERQFFLFFSVLCVARLEIGELDFCNRLKAIGQFVANIRTKDQIHCVSIQFFFCVFFRSNMKKK